LEKKSIRQINANPACRIDDELRPDRLALSGPATCPTRMIVYDQIRRVKAKNGELWAHRDHLKMMKR
jgi:hypothetical protein